MSKQFAELGVAAEFLKSLAKLQISVPTDIQKKTIPVLLKQKEDVVGLAKTGTGKTIAFGLPIVQLIDLKKNNVQAIILVPTRELGQQIYENLISFSSTIPELSIAYVCGGIPIKPQIDRLSKTTHLLVATPGRLIDLIQRKAVNVTNISTLVLDEADEMISSLKKDLDVVIAEIPKKRRTLLFTATLTGAVKQMIQNYMSKHVVHLSADMEQTGHKGIEHTYVVVEPIEKLEVLLHFLNSKDGERGIIFCKTKAAVNKLAKKLAINKFSSGAIHGSLSQGIRDRIMGQFREGFIAILIATDLAARGIDVKQTSYVVNYHLPDTYDAYVHRSGRTARAGANGVSLSIIQKEERIDIPEFEKELGIVFTEVQIQDAKDRDETNLLLWAKKIFKTKPNRTIPLETKDKVKNLFHHLTKEELVEKVLADYIVQNGSANAKPESPETP
ncbi:DEAD/DEAH box helicase [Maribacter chungangensis]|uniref:DEAD/DEAH box helicase n=1 Tax=Maribacter chungangensis TaxID=1069117 RepID=A0ABW3B4K9_9FLAO